MQLSVRDNIILRAIPISGEGGGKNNVKSEIKMVRVVHIAS